MKLLRAAAAGVGYLCAATLLAEVILVVVVATRAPWDAARRERLVGALYGLGIGTAEGASEPSAPDTPQAVLDRRVLAQPWLAQRQTVLGTEVVSGKQLIETARIECEQEETARRAFHDFLVQTRQAAELQGRSELQTTLEVLPPKQAKAILLQMLADSPAELRALLKALPVDRTKKIFAEFKSPEEAEQLHRMMLELGEFAARKPSESEG